MRRILVAGAAAVCLLVEGAGPASAASAPASATSSVASVAAQAPMRAAASGIVSTGAGAQDAAFVGKASTNQTIAQQPERRRTPYRKKRRSGIGRFFGALAFLFIGLPLLLIAALVLFFMMRRGRKQREQAYTQQQYGDGSRQGYQPGPYPGANGQGQDPTRRY